MKRKTNFLIIIFIFLFQSFIFGQSNERNNNIETINTSSCINIMGKVIDEKTGEGVEGVHIILLNIKLSGGGYMFRARSDKNGEFILKKVPTFERNNEYYEIEVDAGCGNIHLKWCKDKIHFRQEYLIKIKPIPGKNVVLAPIKIKRGKIVRGRVRLRENKKIKDFRIYVNLVNKRDYDPLETGWIVHIERDGKFHTDVIPVEEDLLFSIESIIDEEGVRYGNFSKIIRFEKNKEYNDLEFKMPERDNEIRGKIEYYNSGNVEYKRIIELIHCGSQNNQISLTTNKDGYFIVKDFKEGRFKFYIYLLSDNIKESKSFNPFKDKHRLIIKREDKIFIDIKIDVKNNKLKYYVRKKGE